MSSLLKRAIVASLTEHPDAEIYRRAAFIDNPEDLVRSLAGGQVLTKADFLALDDKGKAFLDSAGAWKNFEKISRLIQLGGEKLTYDDLTSPLLPGGKTLIDSAVIFRSTAKVFTFPIWEGRFEEMEKLWYKLSPYERPRGPDGLIPITLKRQLLAAEGKEAPEDRLAKAQLTPLDIRNAAAYDNNFTDVKRKLALAGDYFRKDYVLLPDPAGDSIFDRSFARFEAITKIMQENGERLEVKDYLRQLNNRPSLLERAAEHGGLNKVFEPALWVDRLPDMLRLWSNVKEAWKRPPMTTQGFDEAYAAVEGLTYAKYLEKQSFDGKADFLAPLNAGASEKPVLPLGLKVVWDKIDAVRKHLETRGQALTLADLRTPSGHMGDSILISATKYGYFDKVVEISRQGGDALTMNDFLSKDGHGSTLIDILGEKKQLPLVFTVETWTGQIASMRELWSHVPASHRKQINFQQLETSVKQATLKKIAQDRQKHKPQ